MPSIVEIAALCAHVYDWDSPIEPECPGWFIVQRFGPLKGNDRQRVGAFAPSTSGFAAALYHKRSTGEHVLAIRGTDDGNDIIMNWLPVAFFRPEQLHDARSAMKQSLNETLGQPFYIAGHSLGGALAILLGGDYPNMPVITFNAPVVPGIGVKPADFLEPGFATIVRVLTKAPEPILWRLTSKHVLHVRTTNDPFSMLPTFGITRNPGRTLTLNEPWHACKGLPFPSANEAFCYHKMKTVIAAIRSTPASPLLHHELNWLQR